LLPLKRMHFSRLVSLSVRGRYFRDPEDDELVYWIGHLDEGFSLSELWVGMDDVQSTQLIRIPATKPSRRSELQELGERDFVISLYEQFLGRTPDKTGMQHHLNLLSGGMARLQLKALFQASVEAKKMVERNLALLNTPTKHALSVRQILENDAGVRT
jgi:hypothetical protein